MLLRGLFMLKKDDTQGVLQGIEVTRARRRQWRRLLALRRTLRLEATYRTKV